MKPARLRTELALRRWLAAGANSTDYFGRRQAYDTLASSERGSQNSCSNIARSLILAFCLLQFVLAAAHVRASEIVILGDSWGANINDSVRTLLNARGLKSMRIHNVAVPGSTADLWQKGTYGTMSKIFAQDTNAMTIQLFLGGNDILSKLPSSAAAAAAVAPAETNVVRVLSAIASVSSAPILYSSYDYVPGPVRTGGTALEINSWLAELVSGVAKLVATDPALNSRVTVLNTLGLMQLHYGIPKLSIPPFDPSLPNAELPGPATAFADDVHLTRQGYDILFRKLYADFHAPVLERSSLIARGVGQIEIQSAAGLRTEIKASNDFLNWTSLGTLTNATGTAVFDDADVLQSAPARFYRAVSVAQ